MPKIVTIDLGLTKVIEKIKCCSFLTLTQYSKTIVRRVHCSTEHCHVRDNNTKL